MEFKIPKDARIIIIEGVAGSGKDTLQELLKRDFKDKIVHVYSEEETFFTWKHASVPNMGAHRIRFMRDFIKYLKKELARSPDSIFILNRFHLSVYMAHINLDVNKEMEKIYDEIIRELQKLPIHILFLKLTTKQIKTRSTHSERSTTWKRYQKRAVKRCGFSNIVERYTWEQNKMLEALNKQGISFEIITPEEL